MLPNDLETSRTSSAAEPGTVLWVVWLALPLTWFVTAGTGSRVRRLGAD